jgi:hypothetical protein
MRIERLRLPADFLATLGFPRFFDRVTRLDIINAFQYDQNQFLSLARVTFAPGHEQDWQSILEQDLHVTFVQAIEQRGNSLTCFLRSASDLGFFPVPVLNQGSWAIVPPVAMTPESITFTIIAEESLLPEIHATIEGLGSTVTVLALDDLGRELRGAGSLVPPFPDRQREVAAYAVRQGFYATPKHVTTAAIAKKFGISISAVTEHLRKARRLAMQYFFG